MNNGSLTGGSVVWNFDADTGKLDAALAGASAKASLVQKSLNQADSAGRGAFDRLARGADNLKLSLDNTSSGVLGLIKGLGSVSAVGALGFGSMINAALDQQKAVESARFALKAYEGDATAVNGVLKELVDYATSPLGVLFQREDLFKAASSLKVFGDNTADLVNHVKIMSRVVALGYTNFDELSQILGQVGAAGKLAGIDFDQLTRRGIRLPESMRNATVSFNDLFNAISNAIPAGVLEGRADSIEGRMIRLKSSFRNLGAQMIGINRDTNSFVSGGLGDRFLKLMDDLRVTLGSPEIKTAFANLGAQLADFASRALPLLVKGITLLATNIGTIIPLVISLISLFVALKVVTLAVSFAQLVIGMGQFVTAIRAGTGAVAAFNAITAVNPVALIIQGLAILTAALIFLQLKFDIFGRAWSALQDGFRTSVRFIDEVSDRAGKLARTLRDDAFQWIKDRFDDLKAVLDRVRKTWDDHIEGIKQVVGALTVLLGPALLRAGAQAALAGAQIAASAAISAAAWVASAATATAAWLVWQIKMLVVNGIVAAQMVLSAIASGAAWVAQATVASLAWIGRMALMSAGAVATAVVFVAQAAIGGYAWVINGIRVGTVWLVTVFPRLVASAVRTAVSFVAQAAIAGAAWVAQASRSLFAWILAFPSMVAGAASTAAAFIVSSITAGGAWLAAAASTVLEWGIAFITLISGAIAAGAAMLVAGAQAALAWILGLGPLALVIAAVGVIIGLAYLLIRNWDTVKDWFGKLGGWVLDAVGNFGSLLWNAGRDLVEGLINGIKSMFSKLGSTASDMAGTVTGKIKGLLGIHSPSTVFAEIGTNVVQGLAQGIDRSHRTATNAMSHLSDSLTADSTLNMSPSASLPVLNTDDFVASPAANTTSAQPQQVVHIQLNPSGIVARSRSELRDIAKDMIGSVNEELRARRLPEIGNGAITGRSTAA